MTTAETVTCPHGVVYGPHPTSGSCVECQRIIMAAHTALYGDERPRTRVTVMVGAVGAAAPDHRIELSVPDYNKTPESLADLLEGIVRMLRAPTRDITHYPL